LVREKCLEKRPVLRDNIVIVIIIIIIIISSSSITLSTATAMHGPWRGDHKIHHSLKLRLNP
jgi:hypothetical protein